MTETEAKEKWCPFVRMGVGGIHAGVGGINRFMNPKNADIIDFTKCIGSSCMMWKMVDPDNEKNFNGYCGLMK